MNWFKKILRTALAIIFACGMANLAHAQQAAATFQMPVALNATFDLYDCENAPGPRIVFSGFMALGGMDVALIFRNQREDGAPHERTEEVDVQIAAGIAPGEAIIIPKQPVHGGVGGNPWISFQLVDGDGNALTEEILLGRCVQGAIEATAPFTLDAAAFVSLVALDCTNNPGPVISVSGAMTLQDGVYARFIFRNQRTAKAPHEASEVVDVQILPEGYTLQIPKQPVHGGVGGNPWIWVQFLGGDGGPVSDEIFIGRCVQLLPGN